MSDVGERIGRSLKYEAVNSHELREGVEPERITTSWMDFHNEVRPHPALVGSKPGETLSQGRGGDVNSRHLLWIGGRPPLCQHTRDRETKKLVAHHASLASLLPTPPGAKPLHTPRYPVHHSCQSRRGRD